MVQKFNCIAAACENMGIGNKNDLPWRLKSEMEYFTKMTSSTNDKSKKNIVIMGRRTWESIPPKYKPLGNRINFVLSSYELDLSSYKDVYGFKSLKEIVSKLEDDNFKTDYDQVWVIGGAKLYECIMKSPYFYRLYLTKIYKTYECDTFFPELPKDLKKISLPNVPMGIQSENGINFEYNVYENPNFNK